MEKNSRKSDDKALHSVSGGNKSRYSSYSESNRKRAAKKKKRNQIIAICIFSVLILGLFTAVIITDYSGLFIQPQTNSFFGNTNGGNKMVYSGNNIKEIRIQFGESELDFSASAPDIIPIDSDMQSFTLQYNGNYIARIQYKDDAGTCEFFPFTITGNDEPMKIVAGRNVISVTRNPNYKILSISCTKGITLGDPGAAYINVDVPDPDTTGMIEVEETGYYTFKITAEKTINGLTTRDTYYSAVRVR